MNAHYPTAETTVQGGLLVIPLARQHLVALLMTLGIDAFPEAGIRALSHPGHAFTLMSSGRVIGCSGVMQLFPGVGEATAFLTPELREKFPVSLHKAAVRGLEQIRSNYNYHRIQMHVAPDFKAGCEWARRLGFKWEGVMPMCTPDKRTLIRFGQTWS